MKLRSLRLLVSAVTLATLTASMCAEEGMWTFDNVPIAQIQKKYGFEITQAWLDHVRLSSVRLNDGGSGSFISPDGLLLTNHHVARGQMQKESTAAHNYLKTGFYAATEAEEMKSPDLEINVLESMENVTSEVQAAGNGMNDKDALQATRAKIAAIEKECEATTGLVGQVVTLYQGGQYWLYRYKKYTDVRLVFAPEQQVAFFGGDPDNFTYPRYDLDMAIFRVYENGKPIHTPNYLKWNSAGATPHQLVFVSGNPGNTDRDDTVDQLKLEANSIEPDAIAMLSHRIDVLQQFSARGPEQAREAASQIFFLQNDLKVYVGRKEALAAPEIMAKKEAEETDFRRKVEANPELEKLYGSAWGEIEAADAKEASVIKTFIFRNTDSSLEAMAAKIVDYVAEIKKPDAERLSGYHDAQLASVRFYLESPTAPYKGDDEARIAGSLQEAVQELGASDPWVEAALDGQTPAAAATADVSGTHVGEVAYRKQLIEGGEAAVDASTDPMIVLARRLDPISRASRKMIDAEISAPEAAAGRKLGKARFAVYGTSIYPDATFTLRLSYGTVDGYPMNGTNAPPMTTMYGLYDRSASFSDKPPYNLVPRWADGVSKLNLATPMDFVTTNDIIGGDSGSSVINQKAEVVGLIFDGDIQSLAGDFVYDGRQNRAVAVQTTAIIEALRKLYGAGKLADEIEGVTP